MIERVISGGQTGADRAGWEAAKAAGIATGGWMPKGFLAEDGNHPEFAEMYGARETASRAYPDRTRFNVREACVTLWLGDPRSNGGKLTLRSAQEVPGVLRIVVGSPRTEWTPQAVCRHIINWFDQQKNFPPLTPNFARSINVAGNRESSAPGINAWVRAYLDDVFRLLTPKSGISRNDR